MGITLFCALNHAYTQSASDAYFHLRKKPKNRSEWDVEFNVILSLHVGDSFTFVIVMCCTYFDMGLHASHIRIKEHFCTYPMPICALQNRVFTLAVWENNQSVSDWRNTWTLLSFYPNRQVNISSNRLRKRRTVINACFLTQNVSSRAHLYQATRWHCVFSSICLFYEL